MPFLICSEEEAEKILSNFNKANELSFMKYEIELKNLTKVLFTDINAIKLNDIGIRLHINNLNYLYKIKQTTDKLSKRIILEYPKENKTNLESYNKFLESLYTFRFNKKQMISAYKDELNELVINIHQIIEEAVVREIKNLNEGIKEFEQVSRIANTRIK
jgi:hypothetical protein